jgi:hypothetical protein
MNAIRAFVGHSFTDDGKEVVRKFTDYFDSLEKMNDGFSWVCAKAAEPKLLTQKVMSLIQDRNLFIGICTRKELALDPTNLVKDTAAEQACGECGEHPMEILVERPFCERGKGAHVCI